MKRTILLGSLWLLAAVPSFAQTTVDSFHQTVVSNAVDAVGLTSVPSVDGQSFTSDCIGFVNYVFYLSGIDLKDGYGTDGERGVELLYNGLTDLGLVYSNTNYLPLPGDIVFFDNTYDADDDGEWNDPLSHIGIVESVTKHGTVNYIHYSNSGVKRAQLNLFYPYTYAMTETDGDLYVVNSYLRRDRGEGYDKYYYIGAHFFRAFARIMVKPSE